MYDYNKGQKTIAKKMITRLEKTARSQEHAGPNQVLLNRSDSGSDQEAAGWKSRWTDWKWHVANSVQDIQTFETLLGVRFSDHERKAFTRTVDKFPMAVTPYYLSLIDASDYANDPVFRQSFPSPAELCIERSDMTDPLHEDKDSPTPGITHRYPDRVLFHVSNICSMYCRHCTRKRKVGEQDFMPGRDQLKKGIDYIKNTPQIRDVLLSGGDPFMLSDERIDWILGELGRIDHVDVVRIGSRMPVVLPCRITSDLVHVLKKQHPLWLNTHFNH
ncbi:MAG: KamA family radical SAM protein, partial [Desulfonatronovibrionaceae bacterium]